MSSSRICLVLILAALLGSGCGGERIDCRWIEPPIEIDGLSGDWASLPKAVYREEGISVCFANDSENLYLYFRLNDAQLARSISRRGVTIWLGESKSKQFGINYKSKYVAEFSLGQDGPFPQPDGSETMHSTVELQETTFETLVVLDGGADNAVHVRSDGSLGPAAAFALEGGAFTYEFSIPLATAAGRYGIGTEPGGTIRIGLHYGGMDPEMMRKMREEGGPGRGQRPEGMGPGGGMGGMGGRGGRGGMRGGPPGEMKQKMQAQEIWIKSTLATLKEE